MNSYDTDVIIVGAGPIGLTLALALAHHGVSFRIFEQRDEIGGGSKAHNLIPRSQELLDSLGVRDAIAAKAHSSVDTFIMLEGKPLASFDTPAPSPHGDVLFSSQGVIETELADAVKAKGGNIACSRHVDILHVDDDGVTVSVRHGKEGGAEELRCRYLVGADGVKGTVRKAVGLDYEREPLPGRAIRQIDAKLTWRRSTSFDLRWFFLYPNGFVGVLPVWEGVHRLFFLEDEALVPDRDPTLEEMQARARELIDDTITLSDPVWCSHGKFSHGVSPAFSSGRVFLVGDAGHETLPIGGQGMNAGLHDAVGLGWRLAMTLAGKAGATVLDSYSPERCGEHARLDKQQVRGFNQMLYRGHATDNLISAVAGLVPNLASRVFGGDDLDQLTVAYPESPLSEDRLTRFGVIHRGGVQPGERAPDARVVGIDGADTTLFAHIYNAGGSSWGWCLFGFDGRDPTTHAALDTAFSDVATFDWVKPRRVLAAAAGSESATDLFDLDGAGHAAFGLADVAALVLIRPDGHIAYRGPATDVKGLTDYCRRIAGSPD